MTEPVIYLIGGAAGAAVIGLFGAWIQSRREHRRWLREQRLSAYLEFIRVCERMPPTNEGAKSNVEYLKWPEGYVDQLKDAIAAVRLLGPNRLTVAAQEYLDAAVNMRAISTMRDEKYDPTSPLSETRRGFQSDMNEASRKVITSARKIMAIRG